MPLLALVRPRHADHITLGAARAALVPLEKLAWAKSAHRTKIMSMDDDVTTAWACANGTSISGGFNFALREQAALAAIADMRQRLPQVVAERRPADKLSRSRPRYDTVSKDSGTPAPSSI